MKFEDLALMAPLRRAVSEAGYERPTPIQAATIPVALAGRDVIGCAQTGTGKTAAFCLPARERAYHASGDRTSLHTLILTPTRELAAQIGESLETYGKHLDLYHTVIFGGVNEKPQIKELERGIDLLVATPGRLLDLMSRGIVKLGSVKLFVLDEADRMLDMGFINDVRKVTAALPKERQTLFFSATMPAAIRKLANSLVKDAKSVAVDPVASTVDQVAQSVYFTDKANKRNLLVHLLRDPACTRTVVFARTKHGSDRVARHLEQAGIQAAAIHGNKAQNARTRALEGFRAGKVRVLVATDLAARGIDVDDISHVINFDLPNVAETYVHRIGRTARAGKSGTALSLCDAEEHGFLAGIERLTAKRIDRIDDHPSPAREKPGAAAEKPARGARPPADGRRSGSVRGRAGAQGGSAQGRAAQGAGAQARRRRNPPSRRARSEPPSDRA
jgi:ATP-dependent RNA helicase RhlE